MFISIVVPAYNESKRITPTLKEVRAVLEDTHHTYEIIVVDDGSHDNTADVIQALTLEISQLRLEKLEQNMGKGGAVRHGVMQANGEIILVIDADGSTPFAQYKKLLQAYEQKNSVIAIGSRHLPESNIEIEQPWHRILISRTANMVIQLLLLPGIKDTQCGFKLFPTEIAKDIFAQATINGFGYDMEVLYIAKRRGIPIIEVPVTWLNAEESTLRPIRSTWNTFKELVTILRKHAFRKA